MARQGIATTLSAVVLLTVLVAADVTVASAQENVASAAQLSQLEDKEALLAESLRGAAALGIVLDVQAFLANDPADCDSLPQYLASVGARTSSSGDESGLAFSVNASATAVGDVPGASADNLTLSAPFAGYVPGALDLRLGVVIDEAGGGGTVVLHDRETHFLHLSISPAAASSLCSSTAQSLAAALSRYPCNATLEEAAFALALPALVDGASARGFALTAGWGAASSCSVSFWFTLVEAGVEGVDGTLDWTVLGSGTA